MTFKEFEKRHIDLFAKRMDYHPDDDQIGDDWEMFLHFHHDPSDPNAPPPETIFDYLEPQWHGMKWEGSKVGEFIPFTVENN